LSDSVLEEEWEGSSIGRTSLSKSGTLPEPEPKIERGEDIVQGLTKKREAETKIQTRETPELRTRNSQLNKRG